MFTPIDPKQHFPTLEHDMLKFWEDTGAFKALVEKNRGNKPWSFIDGPITANNSMGVHHAWGRTYKDTFQRYRAMKGFDQRYQNGFDCQGLWVEVEVEKDLGLNSKREIMEYGLDKFSHACRDRVNKYAAIQTEQSKRLGQWMDWEHSYFTMSEENNTTIWYFLKKMHEKGWLYKGNAAVPWCTRCGTALSQHELSDGGYADLTHKSVYVTFPRAGFTNEFFLAWTTTPWTLSSNVALAVNPALEYVKIKHGDKLFILSKKVAQKKFKDAEIIEEFKGSDLVNTSETQYESLYPNIPVQQDTQRVVIPWDEVGEEEGTGIVHIAPGCGEEDNKLGKQFDLKIVVPIDEFGFFGKGFGALESLNVLESADIIIDDLKKRELLERVESITHRYPRCWRCKTECVFRVVDEWFMKADELRSKLKKAAQKVDWRPASSGKRMQNWLDNMGDWIISRKRFWGLALPFYDCASCGELTVIGSKEELRERAVKPEMVDNLESLHRPWIDDIKIICSCGIQLERVKDVGDCWLDAGIVPFSTLHYLDDKSYWKTWYPANFIVESRPQIRLWFYSMLFMSVVLEGKAPYEKAMTYESVVDEKGHEMHKSSGNAIWFDDGVEKMGADVMRWMYLADSPTKNLRFGANRGEEVRRKLLSLWNVYAFFVTYANIDKVDKATLNTETFKPTDLLDTWILALLQQTIEDVNAALDNFEAARAIRGIDHLIEALSNWYVRRSRRRFWKSGNDNNDKQDAYITLYIVLKTITQFLAPALPFISEAIWQNLRTESDPQSVHHNDFPAPTKAFQDKKLAEFMNHILRIANLGRSARSIANIKLRQPLGTMMVKANIPHLHKESEQKLVALLKDELNVKHIEFVEDVSEYATEVLHINARVLGPKIGGNVQQLIALAKQGKYSVTKKGVKIGEYTLKHDEYHMQCEQRKENLSVASEKDTVVIFDTTVTPELHLEGLAREIVRSVQDARQKAGLNIEDHIELVIEASEPHIKQAIAAHQTYIKEETLATTLLDTITSAHITSEATIENHPIVIGIKT
jgi:isoleucyl-tRNA synthetase